MEDILAIIFLFGGGTLALQAFSPVGQAIAERIRGGRVDGIDPEVLSELDQLRHDVVELQERVDFTERLLAQQRDTAQLGGGEKGALP
jgi:hypothetical protein